MADHSKIEWTEATWNPIAGCSVVSPGCTNCYAMRTVAPRLSANPATPHYAGTVTRSKGGYVWTGKVTAAPESVLLKPLAWKRPRMIFVNSTSDLFHEAVPDEVIDRIFAVMALCGSLPPLAPAKSADRSGPGHTFQVLTKRPARMRAYLSDPRTVRRVYEAACYLVLDHELQVALAPPGPRVFLDAWPLPNVWLGTSVEDQARADERLPHLGDTPAAIRFISAEPLLGPLDLSAHLPHLDWVIVGGESGRQARPMHPDWVRSIRDQCAAAGVPFFFKQWGEWAPAMFGTDPDNAHVLYQMEKVGPFDSWKAPVFDPDCYEGINWRRLGKKIAGRLLDGVTHDAMPSPGAARHPLPHAGEGKGEAVAEGKGRSGATQGLPVAEAEARSGAGGESC